MSKSIKLKNDNYIDSSSIVHNRIPLSGGFMKVYSSAIAQNGSITTNISTNARESKRHYIAYCVGNTSNGDNTWIRIYLLRRGYDGNHITASEIHNMLGSGGAPSFTFEAAEDGNIRIRRSNVGGNASVVLYQLAA